MPPKPRRAAARVACAAVIMLALAPGRVMAHTELDFSLPAQGTTVGEPVSEISVGFTDVVALVGNGFEVHDPQGNVLTPFVVTDDSKVFRFQIDPPLAGGVVVVDYHVRALDGDVQDGSFSFTVAAPLPATASDAATMATASTPSATLTTTPPTTPTTTPTTPPTTIRAPSEAGPASNAPGTSVESALVIDGSDAAGDRERTLIFVVLLGIVAAAGGFLVVRSRRTA